MSINSNSPYPHHTKRQSSGFGVKGSVGRCYPIWSAFEKCLATKDHFKECMDFRDDYVECLHHRKEVRLCVCVWVLFFFFISTRQAFIHVHTHKYSCVVFALFQPDRHSRAHVSIYSYIRTALSPSYPTSLPQQYARVQAIEKERARDLSEETANGHGGGGH